MIYKLIDAYITDINRLIEYKRDSILKFVNNLDSNEINKINKYIIDSIPKQLYNYKIIIVDDVKVGCLLVTTKDDGVILDEIYIEEKYRNNGIGKDIMKNILDNNNKVYLWVYKLNIRAISLYKKVGFIVIDETETRYYMKYDKFLNSNR